MCGSETFHPQERRRELSHLSNTAGSVNLNPTGYFIASNSCPDVTCKSKNSVQTKLGIKGGLFQILTANPKKYVFSQPQQSTSAQQTLGRLCIRVTHFKKSMLEICEKFSPLVSSPAKSNRVSKVYAPRIQDFWLKNFDCLVKLFLICCSSISQTQTQLKENHVCVGLGLSWSNPHFSNGTFFTALGHFYEMCQAPLP
jgi:hypothetical protein